MANARDWKMEAYWRLPLVLQEAALNFYAGRLQKLYYGPGFEEWRQLLQEWRSWNRSQAETW